jgi:hypothetical protein
MKNCIHILINKIFKQDLEILFGVGSYVVINYCKFCTNNSRFIIDCKILTSDIELSKDVYPDGLIFLVEEAWKYTGLNEKISVITSIDIL